MRLYPTNKGLTLIELLIAVSIFSVIALSLYGLLGTTMKIGHLTRRNNAFYRQTRQALEIMQEDIEHMIVFRHNRYPDSLFFNAQDSALTFSRPSPEGIRIIRYYVSEASLGKIHRTEMGRTYQKLKKVVSNKVIDQRRYLLIRQEQSFVERVQQDSLPSASGSIKILSTYMQKDGLRLAYEYSKGHFCPYKVRLELRMKMPGQEGKPITFKREVLIVTKS